jgi:tetratricopeptide (TPR) repeat protein
MLKFFHLFNLGMVGALVVPAALQDKATTGQLERSLQTTDQAILALDPVRAQLGAGDYAGVEAILSATEPAFGQGPQRSALLDQLRRELGELEREVQLLEVPAALEHTTRDPLQGSPEDPSTAPVSVAPTVGLTDAERDEVAEIFPPIPGAAGTKTVRKHGRTYSFEKPGFTVDAVRQGRAYYRAERYAEALRLFETRAGEPEADYWTGRVLERLGRVEEAVAAYTRVIENEAAGALAERARMDREFVRWVVDFEREVEQHDREERP